MKTLSKKLALRKLQLYVDLVGLRKNAISYKMVVQVIEGQKTLRPCYVSSRGRFTHNLDHTYSVTGVLESLGIEYILSNTSKRGGLTGNLITITTKIK